MARTRAGAGGASADSPRDHESGSEHEDSGAEDDLDGEEHPETERTVRGYGIGKENMLFRRLMVEDGEPARWAIAESTDPDHKADSRVHRYDRVIGFRPSQEDQAEIDSTNAVKKAWEQRRQEAVKHKSHHRRVELQAMFERWCLARASDSPYTAWLKSLQTAVEEEGAEEPRRKTFMAPPPTLVVTYIQTLRKDEEDHTKAAREYDHKGGPIKNAVSAISATCTEFGSPPIAHLAPIHDLVRKYLNADGHTPSEAFDMVKDMEQMFNTVWTLRWSMLKKIQCWSMLLIAIVIFGRASCMTTFCPLLQDLELPQAPSQWDADGLPKYIILSLRDWKWRTESKKCKCPRSAKCFCSHRYKMYVHRNVLDQRFCPVFWLLLWLKYSGVQDGPIFQYLVRGGADKGDVSGKSLTEDQWTGMTSYLFKAANLYFPAEYKKDEAGNFVKDSHNKKILLRGPHGVTNQGIRRTAAQWAGRSGCKDSIDVQNNGRWKSVNQIIQYVAQGAKKRLSVEQENGQDPIFRTWVWKPVTVPSTSTANEL